ncbi:MAG: HDOD domain-containing protein [Lachnospiraceae bacterium]|nr:HDOD domain-containing protein [Lachnospiraceae bacterium]
MLATLIPLFDEKMTVKAYSLFTQKANYLMNPIFLGTGLNDGAGHITGLEVINSIGIESLTADSDIFVPVTNVSLFSAIDEQCDAPHNRIVILIDRNVKPEDMYVNRIRELKAMGYRFAIRKLAVPDFEPYRSILSLMDYIFLDHKKIVIDKAKIYFTKVYPDIKLIAGNIENQEAFDTLKEQGGYQFYEGEFYRVPITKGSTDVAPVKINYIELLNTVNSNDFDLTKAADIIGRDTALVISLLEMVNHMAINSEITSIRHAAAMLGQRELKKWITTAVTKQLCDDKPSEVARVSLLRAKYAENLAPVFEQAGQSQELFMMGLFSVLDVILGKTMAESLEMLKVSKNISRALIDREGPYADVYNFILQYESANWTEIDRVMLLREMDANAVYDAYIDSLKWYRTLFIKY